MKNAILILLIFSYYPLVVKAQQSIRITGIVTDNQGNPLPGANVFISTLHLGSATDDNGKYEITVPAEYSKGQGVDLRAQYIGYKSQTAAITLTGDSIEQNFSLKQDVFQSDEVVVTGLASKTSKGRAEVSVSRVEAAGLEKTSSFQSISQMVEGQISGVQVTSSSGNIGGGFRFYVRGGGGLNGDGQPVVYVDGIRVASYEVTGIPDVGGQGISMLATLSPENIAKIQVLKGPAAAAMYGTSGSNGVVLITTKKGSPSQKLSVNYKYAYGLNTQSYKYKTSNFLSANSANAIFRNGLIRQNILSLSGGSNLLRYYASFDDRYEEGNIPDNNMDRKVLRANLTSYATSYLTLKISSGYSLTNIRRPLDDNTHMGFLMNVLSTPKAYSWGTDSAAVFQIKDESKMESFTGGIQITLTPLNNLVFYFNGGIDNNSRRQDQTYPQNLAVLDFSNGRRTIFNADYRQYTYDFNGRYTYNISGLYATSIIGAQLFDETDRSSYLGSGNFETNLISDISAGSTEYIGESFFNTREAGIFTEHNFSYNNQYFLTLGLRKDYASSIGPDAPSILYPQISFALRFDKYSWFPSNLFDLFKLRAAYGESGQLPNDLAPISLLWGAANVGGKVGAVIKNIGNNSIKPERIKEFETGFDAEFLKNYSLEFTYYRQNAVNSIFYKYESPSTGLTETSVPFNVGGIKNWGFESLFQASLIRSRDYGLDLSLIWNYQNNLVTNLGGADLIISPWVNVIKEGLPNHEFYHYKVLGAKFDSSGIYTGVNSTSDKVDLGNPIPNHTGSFAIKFRFLKNFNLYALMDWALNRKMLNFTKAYAALNGDVPEKNILEAQLGQTKDHPEITRLIPGTQEYINAANRYARLVYDYPSNWIEDAGYFKIRELSLSYSFGNFLSKTGYNYLKDIVIGVSVLNVWTFTKYSGADIELNATDNADSRSLARGSDIYTLQHPRVYNMWVSVSL